MELRTIDPTTRAPSEFGEAPKPSEEQEPKNPLTDRVNIHPPITAVAFPSPEESSMFPDEWAGSVSPRPESGSPMKGFLKELHGELEISPLDIFMNAYYELEKNPTDVNANEIRLQFCRLDVELQQRLRNAIRAVLMEDITLDRQEVELKVNEVILNPFLKMKNPLDPMIEVVVMSQALIKAKAEDNEQVARKAQVSLAKHGIPFEGTQKVARVLFYGDVKD